jgi:hypothetical protein
MTGNCLAARGAGWRVKTRFCVRIPVTIVGKERVVADSVQGTVEGLIGARVRRDAAPAGAAARMPRHDSGKPTGAFY